MVTRRQLEFPCWGCLSALQGNTQADISNDQQSEMEEKGKKTEASSSKCTCAVLEALQNGTASTALQILVHQAASLLVSAPQSPTADDAGAADLPCLAAAAAEFEHWTAPCRTLSDVLTMPPFVPSRIVVESWGCYREVQSWPGTVCRILPHKCRPQRCCGLGVSFTDVLMTRFDPRHLKVPCQEALLVLKFQNFMKTWTLRRRHVLQSSYSLKGL